MNGAYLVSGVYMDKYHVDLDVEDGQTPQQAGGQKQETSSSRSSPTNEHDKRLLTGLPGRQQGRLRLMEILPASATPAYLGSWGVAVGYALVALGGWLAFVIVPPEVVPTLGWIMADEIVWATLVMGYALWLRQVYLSALLLSDRQPCSQRKLKLAAWYEWLRRRFFLTQPVGSNAVGAPRTAVVAAALRETLLMLTGFTILLVLTPWLTDIFGLPFTTKIVYSFVSGWLFFVLTTLFFQDLTLIWYSAGKMLHNTNKGLTQQNWRHG